MPPGAVWNSSPTNSHPEAPTRKLLRNHTLLPLYLPFLPKRRAAKCKQAALGDGGKSLPFLTGIMASKIKQPTNLRLCPFCAAEQTATGRAAQGSRLSNSIYSVFVCIDATPPASLPTGFPSG